MAYTGWSLREIGNRFRTGISTVEDTAGAIGRINSPLLDLPLKNSLAMKAGVGSVTFTNGYTLATAYDAGVTYAIGDKASYGGFNYVSKQDSNSGNTPANGSDYWQISAHTYIDRYGVLKYVGVDEARFEKEGILIEGSSTNISLYSEEFDNDAWTKARSKLDVNTTDTLDPYGLNLAEKLMPSTDDGGHYVRQLNAANSSTIYTLSAFVKAAEFHEAELVLVAKDTDGNEHAISRHILNMVTGDIAISVQGKGAKVEKLPNGWWRFQISGEMLDNYDKIDSRIFIDDAPSNSGDTTDGMYIFGIQTEELPFASSYIPTVDTAVTRGQDICNVTIYNNVQNQDSVSIITDFSILGNKGIYDTAYQIRKDAINTWTNLRPKVTSLIVQNEQYGNGYTWFYCPPATNTINHCVTMDGQSNRQYMNGEFITSDTKTSDFIPPDFSQGLNIGSDLGDKNTIFGHMSNFKIYDMALTSTEVKLLAGR